MIDYPHMIRNMRYNSSICYISVPCEWIKRLDCYNRRGALFSNIKYLYKILSSRALMNKLIVFGLAMSALLAIGSVSYILDTPADASTNQRNNCENKKNVVGVCAGVNANIEENNICAGILADARDQCDN